MTKRHEAISDDAIRLLCNAVQKIHHLSVHGEGFSPACKNAGELVLQDALEYLAYGDTRGARSLIEIYDEWLQSGNVPWPYNGEPSA
jgi:hypothetical protein